MSLDALEREILENDRLRAQLDALTSRVRSHARAMREGADACDKDAAEAEPAKAHALAVLAQGLRRFAEILERDLERWGAL